MVALRLREADLPTEPVVALMSTEHRFAIGAGILAAPLLAASIGFLADSVLTSQDRVTQREDNKPPLETLALEGLAVVAAVAVAFELLPDDADTRHGFKERVAIFLPVLVGAGVGAIIAESLEAPSFDEARITIRDHSVVTGGYITSTDNAVVLTTRCEVIEAVPRDRIERISVGPGEVKRTHC